VTAVDVHTVLVLTGALSNNNAAEGLLLLTTALQVAARRAGLTSNDLITAMEESGEVNAEVIAQVAAEPST